jgi:polysaccharide pyruvyl transferase WcaK-like protein
MNVLSASGQQPVIDFQKALADSGHAVDCPQIALLTPYSGSNLGDSAIQDAVIANLRLRIPDAQFSGISLNSENFIGHHGSKAFPLCASRSRLYGMSREASSPTDTEAAAREANTSWKAAVKNSLRKVPGVGAIRTAERELRHCMEGYRFLRSHNLLLISGGGQLDEEWGGAWGHPFALYKWAILARMARVPLVFVSVGAGKTSARMTRFFLSRALRKARYRSYRDKNSRAMAAKFFSSAAEDSIVPDLAFGLPTQPQMSEISELAQGYKIIAISPISYAKPQSWAHEDAATYVRYLEQLAAALSQLLEQGYFLVMVWSARADQSTIADLLDRLPAEAKKKFGRQIHTPEITNWKDLLGLLCEADFLIASRLHSVILGFVAQKPTIAVSFDPKVDWVMEDLNQTQNLLHINNFTAEDIVQAAKRATAEGDKIKNQISAYQQEASNIFARQYDVLAELALAGVAGRKAASH